MKYDAIFISEVLNGAWSILAIICSVICSNYILEEWFRRHQRKPRWTIGMSVASSMLAMSIGSFLTRLTVFFGNSADLVHGQGLQQWQIIVLSFGGFVGAIGYLLAIRALSLALIGRWPWIFSIAAVTVFVFFELSRA